MITNDLERWKNDRTYRFVANCSPRLWIALGLLCIASTPLHASEVILSADTTLPQVDFAVSELRGVLTTAGHAVTTTGLDALPDDDMPTRIVMADQEQTTIIDKMRQRGANLSTPLRAEGFSLRRTTSNGRVTYWVIGADKAGVMYGGMELAEIIETMGLKGVRADDQNPYMPLRGIKFNCPLDERTPTYSNHNGDSQRQNVLVMWDMDFWKTYLDDMARFRYNYLSLWNLHPFPSMVRVPGYEKVALEDVQSVGQTLKMTMDQKITFWREVMRYARDRNVDVYVVTWNIFITDEKGIYGRTGQYGLTPEFDNPVTTDYFRKSVKQLILTYPDLAGVGLTTGERMPNLTTAQKEAWAFATYGQGVLDAAAAQPGRKIRLIHRQHQTGTQEIAKTFQPLLDHADIDFIFSFKYAKAHVQSSTTQPYCDDFVNRWYIEGCCSKPSYAETDSGFHDINRFITLGTHPGTDNIAIPDYVEAVSSGREVEGTSPIQVSQQLHTSSDKALQILDQFPKVTKKELKRTLGDIRAMAYMGKYYAHKIRGATELALYRQNKKEEHRSSAVVEMSQAASFWDLYTSTALKQYHNPVDLNRVILVDWQALGKEVQKDIAIARRGTLHANNRLPARTTALVSEGQVRPARIQASRNRTSKPCHERN